MKWHVFPWEEMLLLGKRVFDWGRCRQRLVVRWDTLCLRIPHEF